MSPKLSLFTPAHKLNFLPEVYESLLQQDYRNWEWVILLNGEALNQTPNLPADDRIRWVNSTTGSSNIGALKREACDACTGESFLELDYDDNLVSGILTKVAQALNEGAGFIYSDVAIFSGADLTSWGYSKFYGWEHAEVTIYGQPFVVTKNFPLTPRSLCEIHYAPDHIRAWSRKAYYLAGGHDPELSVADDHQLVCKTYLTGVKFTHLDCAGYLYRAHSENTVKLRNKAIQDQQALNRQKYMRPLIEQWLSRTGFKKVELLVMKNKGEWNYNKRLPLAHNSVGYLVVSDVLQYLPPERIVPFFNEAYNALIPGGYMTVAVPSPAGLYADQDPRVKTRFNINSFLYYTRREFAVNMPGVKCRFDLIQHEDIYPSPVHKEFDMKMLCVDLCALKGQRHPGPQRI